METKTDLKVVKTPDNGAAKPGSLDNPLEEKNKDIKITEEDLTNLKQIFTWALTITVRDRSTLASIVTFENILFKKLESLKK